MLQFGFEDLKSRDVNNLHACSLCVCVRERAEVNALAVKMKLNHYVMQFADDVFLPTDEPHGSIQASLSRSWSKM